MPIPGTAPSVVVGGAALFENARDSDFPQLIHYRATRLDMSIGLSALCGGFVKGRVNRYVARSQRHASFVRKGLGRDSVVDHMLHVSLPELIQPKAQWPTCVLVARG